MTAKLSPETLAESRGSTAIVPIEQSSVTLGEPAGVHLTKTGLTFSREVPIEEWVKLGEKLNQVEGAIQWWVGDWLLYGEKAYGEKYVEALAATGYEYQSLANMKTVSASVPFSLRRENLSWSHHKEVAALPPEQQTKLLAWAEKEKVSVKELRAEIKQQDQIAPPSNSEVQGLRAWLKTECPGLDAVIQPHTDYKADSKNFNLETRDLTADEVKFLCKILCELRSEGKAAA